jgi:hypothetical protein
MLRTVGMGRRAESRFRQKPDGIDIGGPLEP